MASTEQVLMWSALSPSPARLSSVVEHVIWGQGGLGEGLPHTRLASPSLCVLICNVLTSDGCSGCWDRGVQTKRFPRPLLCPQSSSGSPSVHPQRCCPHLKLSPLLPTCLPPVTYDQALHLAPALLSPQSCIFEGAGRKMYCTCVHGTLVVTDTFSSVASSDS